MNREYYTVLLLTVMLIAALVLLQSVAQMPKEDMIIEATCADYPQQSRIALPEPDLKGKALEDAIKERRSVRNYSSEELSLHELSMLLWAGDGITSEEGLRSAPSAGGLYPIDLYVVPSRVENASCGLYRYVQKDHELILVKEGKFSGQLYGVSYGQSHVRDAAALMLLVATPERTTEKYGDVGDDYVLMEAGHIAQNMLLEAVSLGLGAVPVGGFDREAADRILSLDERQDAIYLVAVGR